MTKDKKQIAYKAFDLNWQCRGYQYEVGKTYKHEGEVIACESGFHSCQHPLDIFNYYDPCESKFAVVEIAGETVTHGTDTKIASAEITIKAELHLHDLIQSAVKYVFDNAKWLKKSAVTGEGQASKATGYRGAASATGYRGAAMASGRFGKAKGSKGNALFLCERDDNWDITHTWAGIVGKKGIKADTWYMLKNGKPVEVPS